MSHPSSLFRTVSPPPVLRRKRRTANEEIGETSVPDERCNTLSSLAAIESGETTIRDHLDYFSKYLSKVCRPVTSRMPRLPIDDFVNLYKRNQHPHGHHFVVHQHNHPIAGVHYDLRLQFSETSCISFAIPYGLPGNPNSKRSRRMAVETRVHNIWNNLIESASYATGSLLIWDTGEYTVLPRKRVEAETEDEQSDTNKPSISTHAAKPENKKLIEAFQTHSICLRLHGTRLPKTYTITLRLPSTNDNPMPNPSQFPRKRKRKREPTPPRSSPSPTPAPSSSDMTALQPDKERANQNAEIHTTNAHPGAQNTIGAVYQRQWYLTLDKPSSGFVRSQKGMWVRKEVGDSKDGFETFLVLGADVERSILTGRVSEEVFMDEGVEGFKRRGEWRAVLE